MSEKLTILAPAKINVFLDVLSNRPDGYHDISSVMQTVGIFDRIDVTKNDPDGDEKTIFVKCDDAEIDGENNIVYRAAETFFAKRAAEKYAVSFEISKRIPKMAGLGGGSSDAAAALIALNELYGAEMPLPELAEVAASVGSDVPFLIYKGTCVVGGRGEIVESCTPMPDCVIAIAVPERVSVSTPEAYKKIDAVDKSAPIGDMTEALLSCSIEKIGKSMFNKFEYVQPDDSKIFEIKKKFVSLGSPAVMMSGSGSAVFALFDNVQAAKNAADALSDEAETFVCAPVGRTYPYIEI
ncbi:MAG: 4-(cytidine 5'-diphospho)-2-C-methyl-D-erythritol kinase [Clostridia bacterium]|nr:4-(cytidine 5'-diphospho)-2-C-methyl-D-erythritol kinase [Clostridia bacterium]